jgi:hypothetical protein
MSTTTRILCTLTALALALTSPVSAQDPAPPCAMVEAVSPAITSPLGGEQITLEGFGFSSVGSVWVDGSFLPPNAWSVESDSQIVLIAPPATTLGSVPVTVICFGGIHSGELTYAVPPEPLLTGPEVFENGDDIALAWSAEPSHLAYLLLDTTGQVINAHGGAVVVYELLLPQGPTDLATGVGSLSVDQVTGLPIGMELFMQVVTVAPGGGAASIELSNILAMDVAG